MPSRPARLTSLSNPDAVHVVNQLFREIEGRIDDVQKSVPPHNHLKTTGTLVFGTVGAQSTLEATLYVPGASTQGVAHVSPTQGTAIPAGITWSAYVSGQNQVRVRISNATGTGILVKSIPWNVFVIQ